MSLFLAPIHTWLFNKIIILEEIEKNIMKQFNQEAIVNYHNELKEKISDYIPNQPIETLIDQSNIHGWLQDRITKAETRQAALINKLLSIDEKAKEKVEDIYYKAGVNQGKKIDQTIEEPTEIFNVLNNVLLEGMPCDRVNQVVEQTSDTLVWETVQCVHKNNWESNGVDVAIYYGFRASLIKGFVTTISDDFSYTYSNNGKQVHEITRK